MPYLAAAARAAGPRIFTPDTGRPASSRVYGPTGTTDSPQYDLTGRPTGRHAGSAARQAEKAAEKRARAADGQA